MLDGSCTTASRGACGLDREHVAQPRRSFAGADLAEPGLGGQRLEVRHHARHPIVAVHAREQPPAETAGLLRLGHEECAEFRVPRPVPRGSKD